MEIRHTPFNLDEIKDYSFRHRMENRRLEEMDDCNEKNEPTSPSEQTSLSEQTSPSVLQNQTIDSLELAK